ncbi:MAG TPA: amidohydrolase family protein [Vicinamibacterales bacterium]|nr:amidohydrolase family protein [Vicinamibacterales bacterium]
MHPHAYFGRARRATRLSIALLAAFAQPGAAQATATYVAFVGATVVPMDSPRVLRGQIVLVHGDRIVSVGPARTTPLPPAARRIDARGLFLFPGLADMHIHLLEGSAYFPLLLANGVTTVRHMATPPDMRTLRAQSDSGTIIGPTIFTAGPLLDGSPPVWPGSDVVVTADQARQAVVRQKGAGYDFLKVYDNLSPAAYDAIMETADSLRIRVAGHVSPRVGLEHVLSAHQWSIEHLTGYFEWLQTPASPFAHVDTSERFARPAHLLPERQLLVDWVDTSRIREIARRTAEAGTWNVPTLVAWRNAVSGRDLARAWTRPGMQFATPMLHRWWSSDTEYTAAQMAARRRGDTVRAIIVKALHDAGARIVVGTDAPHPFVMPGYAVHDELRNFVRAGLSPYEALTAATADAAEFMGVPGEFGVIRPGARADLVLTRGNPLDNIANASRIVGVMVRGHWLTSRTLRQCLRAARCSALFPSRQLTDHGL